MFARVTRWEGASGDELRALASQINEAEGPPEGVPASGIMLLIAPDEGRSITVSLFDTEDDLQKGHEALSAMSPPDTFSGRRTAVELYEVASDRRRDS